MNPVPLHSNSCFPGTSAPPQGSVQPLGRRGPFLGEEGSGQRGGGEESGWRDGKMGQSQPQACCLKSDEAGYI